MENLHHLQKQKSSNNRSKTKTKRKLVKNMILQNDKISVDKNNPGFDKKKEEEVNNEYYSIYYSTNKSSNFSHSNENYLYENSKNSNIIKLEDDCLLPCESKNENLPDSNHINSSSLKNESLIKINSNKKARIIIPKINFKLISRISPINNISSSSQAITMNNKLNNQNMFDYNNLNENFSKLLNSYSDRTNFIDPKNLSDTNSNYKFIRERNNFREIADITDSSKKLDFNSTNKEKQSVIKNNLNCQIIKKDPECINILSEKCRISCEKAMKLQKKLTHNLIVNSYKNKKLKDFNDKIDLNFVKNIPIENEEKQLFVYGKNSKKFNPKGYYMNPYEIENGRQLNIIDKINDIAVYRVKNVLMKRFGMQVGNVKKEKLNFMKSDFKEKHKKIKFLLNSDFDKNIQLLNKIEKIHSKANKERLKIPEN